MNRNKNGNTFQDTEIIRLVTEQFNNVKLRNQKGDTPKSLISCAFYMSDQNWC